MASCQFSAGQPLPCGKYAPGIKNLYLINFFSGSTNVGENLTYTVDATGLVTGMTILNGKAYQVSLLKQAGELTHANNSSDTNGTIGFEDTFTFYISQFSNSGRTFEQLLSFSKVYAVVQDRNGNYILMGSDGSGVVPSSSSGCDLIPSSATTGKDYNTDTNGYTFILSAKEKVAPLFISPSVISSLISF